MDWLTNLFIGSGIAHSIFALCLVIGCGLFLSHKLKIKGITLGITWILFCGIAFSHYGMRLDPMVEAFAKDLGLILFVYSIGLQVGPGFFSSFGKQSLKMNLMAATIVLLGCLTAYIIHLTSGVDIATMVGVLSGAVTNTPGLGAAEQAYMDIRGVSNPNIAAGYAMAYPLGVVGIILSLMAFKWFFRISLDQEEEKVNATRKQQDEIEHIDIRLTNPQVDGVRISELRQYCNVHFIVSRLVHPNGTDMVAEGNSVLHTGDTIRVVIDKRHKKNIMLLGEQTKLDDQLDAPRSLVTRHFMITKPELNGKRIGDLHVRETYRVSITRIRRAGVELLATHDLILQLGDRITIVGEESVMPKIENVFGNATKKLDAPNLISLFFGIVLGITLGSIPFSLPGLSQPFKLGLAGGTLIVAILIAYFGPKHKIVTYTTTSANLMIREIGISLFLAAVGLGAGKDFIPTLVNGGYVWIGYGVMITLIPLLIVGIISRLWLKLDYFSLMGLLSGSMTDPPALAYATSQSSQNDNSAVAYSTVYPLTMFLRVLTAQVMIMVLL